MELKRNIKVKNSPWTIIPPFSLFAAYTIYPNIYVSKNIYKDLLSKNPNPRNVATIIHEQTHIERQKTQGWIIWGIKYLFIPSFRFAEELEAIKKAMTHLKKEGGSWDTKRTARFLSSYPYLWCSPYSKAKRILDEAWEQA